MIKYSNLMLLMKAFLGRKLGIFFSGKKKEVENEISD